MLKDDDVNDSPVSAAREDIRIPPNSELPKIRDRSERASLTLPLAALHRDLHLGKVWLAKPYYADGPSTEEERFLHLIAELRNATDHAWAGHAHALRNLPSIIPDYLTASANWFGSSRPFFEDLERARAITSAACWMISDELVLPISEELVIAAIHVERERLGGFISQEAGARVAKGIDKNITWARGKALTQTITGNTKRGPQGPRNRTE